MENFVEYINTNIFNKGEDKMLDLSTSQRIEDNEKKFRRELRRYLREMLNPAPVDASVMSIQMPIVRTLVQDLEDFLANKGKSFSEMLVLLIEEKNIDAPTCYKRANIDRRTFSKIINDKSYTPSKQMVLAFAVALQLSIKEAEDFLRFAGYAFADNHTLDLIVQFFIRRERYDIDEINRTLYDFKQPCLGSSTK